MLCSNEYARTSENERYNIECSCKTVEKINVILFHLFSDKTKQILNNEHREYRKRL